MRQNIPVGIAKFYLRCNQKGKSDIVVAALAPEDNAPIIANIMIK